MERPRVTYAIDVTLRPFVPKSITTRLINYHLPNMLAEWDTRAREEYARAHQPTEERT